MLKCRKLFYYEHISRSQKRVAGEKERDKLVIWISLQNHSQKLVIDEMKPYGSSSNLKQIENRTSKEQHTLYFERIVEG